METPDDESFSRTYPFRRVHHSLPALMLSGTTTRPFFSFYIKIYSLFILGLFLTICHSTLRILIAAHGLYPHLLYLR
jgi:hypothetical protein